MYEQFLAMAASDQRPLVFDVRRVDGAVGAGHSSAAAAAAASAGVEEEEEGLAGDLDDLLTLDVKSPPIKGGGKSTGEEEPDDDAFDAFFKERTS
mmetsp:Transcript_8417/g.12184  ORF Transcript_8417/g.12184 Transcript_8417/m.12184 type:complete len:95 (+) Transcript_8417:1014-1298(+)